MSLTTLVPIPDGINNGLTSARQATMLSLLGKPRAQFDQSCQPITHATLKTLVRTEDFGIFRATGLKPALDSLAAVLADIKAEKPDVYAALGSSGMLCVRNVRGSATAISNHSWGTAIDLNINGVLDPYGDGRVQRGLVEIAPIFNRHKWYWGAAFRKEDGMHFECSEQLIRQWAAIGALSGTAKAQTPPPPLLVLGDRGPEVVKLQKALNTAQDPDIVIDGAFGHATFAAVVAFQGQHGLTPDGAVGKATWGKLLP